MATTKVEGFETTSLVRGDPRMPTTDIDSWYNGLLGTIEPPTQRPWLWASDSGLCARKNVLHSHNSWIPNEKTPASQGYMAIGVALEDMLAAGLKRHGRLVVQGTRLIEMPQLKISGKIDLIVFDHQDQLALVEVKSCGNLPSEPKHDHLSQIQTYCAVSGIHRAWLTYISRTIRHEYGSQLSLRTFAVDTGREALHSRLQTASLSVYASRLHRLPPVPVSFRKHTECHYCEYRDSFCWLPRPGLLSKGASEPQEPLQEMSIVELWEGEREAASLAETLLLDSPHRKYLTIQKLLLEDRLPTDIEERLEKEKRDAYTALIS